MFTLRERGQYADVRRLLFDSAVSYGATIRQQARITSVEFGADGRPSVRLASGEAIEADVVVGTDGPESVLRRHIVGADVKETALGVSLFRCGFDWLAAAAERG